MRLACIRQRHMSQRRMILSIGVIEFIDAFNKVGAVRKKKDELHKLAEANRGFSHYRWW